MKKRSTKNRGRKLFDGKKESEIIQKLEHVWALGGTDEEAALYAEISKAALSNYLKTHSIISERKEALKLKPILKARLTVVNALSNPEMAKWYLTKKMPKEFKDVQFNINDNETKIEIEMADEDKTLLKQALVYARGVTK